MTKRTDRHSTNGVPSVGAIDARKAKEAAPVDAFAAGVVPAAGMTGLAPAAMIQPAALVTATASPPALRHGHRHPGKHGAVQAYAPDSDAPAANAVPDQTQTQQQPGKTDDSPPATTPAPNPPAQPTDGGTPHVGGAGGNTALIALGSLAGVGVIGAALAGGGDSRAAAATPNTAPVGTADSYSTAEDTTLTVAAAGVLTNDTDAENNALSAVLVSGPAHGTLSLNANGSFSYTPAANYNGADSFTYKPNDGRADGNTVTVSLTVTAVNDAPVAVADSYTTVEDTVLTVAAAGVLANDSDVEGSALTAALVAGPAHGTLTLNANGSFTYTPAANYNGADSFTYKPNDGTTDGNTVTVALTVTPVNDAPVAVADSYTTAEDTALTVAAAGVLANDTDVDGNTLSAVLVAGPAHGTLALNANGSFTYTPAANYNGADSFTYKPNDGTADGNTVTVALTVTPVNDAPVAGPNAYATNEDTPLVVGAPGVLNDDTDVDGDTLTAVLVNGPTKGTLALAANGSFTYMPNANANGPDSFTYKPNDGKVDGNTVTVTLIVMPVNDAPVGVADSFTTAEDTTLIIAQSSLLANDTDVDGDKLTAILVAGPTHGTLDRGVNGSFLYTPNANYNGADSFTYKPNDGTVDGNTVTVSLTVTPVNDAPVGVADSYTTAEDTVLKIAAAGVLANDTDVEGNALTAVLVAGPAHGTLNLNADGSFLYSPAANYNGPDSFTYKPNDGAADGNTVTVSLTITPVNDAPVAVADSYTTAEDTQLTVAAPGVLGNDSDVDGNTLKAVLVSNPTHGMLGLNADGSFTYTPTANYNGGDSFTYKVNDGTVDGNTVTVSLTVTPVNDAPVGVADSYTTAEDTTLTIAAPGVLVNDTDVEGNALTAVLLSGPAHGTLALNPDGSFTYTPAADYNGTDSFTYTPNDGMASGAPVTVSLTVTPVNDAPVAVADSYTTNEDTPLTVAARGVLGNDTDVDRDALTAALVAGPGHGTLTLNPDGSFTYTPDTNYNGTDSFTYRASDGSLNSNTATVTLTVNAVDDAPVAVVDSYSLVSGTTLNVPATGVLANDTDVEHDPLTAMLVAAPANGTLTLNPDGSFAYTPNSGYSGTDSFTYRANDGTLSGNTATVSLTINPANMPPVATADSYMTAEDMPLTVVAPGVLGNDTDPDNNMLTAVLVSGPGHGTLNLNPNGSFTYTPAADYNGPDSFTYKPNDGTVDGNTVTVALTVTPVNDAPVAVNDTGMVGEDNVLTVPAATGLLANDTDVEHSALTVNSVGAGMVGSQFALASGALLTVNADGSYVYNTNGKFDALRPGQTTTDSFTYTASDGAATSNTATATITIQGANDAPVAVADSYTTAEDTPLTVAGPGVLANDTDADHDMLTAVVVSGPGHGTLNLNPNGGFVYTPAADYNGADSFTYKPNDGTVDGNTVTVNLTVTPVNDAPVAVNDTGTVGEDNILTVGAGGGLLANDTDVEHDTLTVNSVGGGTVGTQFALASGALLTVNADGSYVYNTNGKFESLRPGQTATDSFTYTASDGAATSNTATATITIQGANEVPVGVNDTYTGITGNTPITYAAAQGVLANDTDPDQPASALTVTQVNGMAIGAGAIAIDHGAVTMNADGSFTFVPQTGYVGPASFTYTLRDADGGTSTATASLTVTNQVWYVDSTYAGANGASDGSYLRPFTDLSNLSNGGADVDSPGDSIVLHGSITGSLVLEADQKVYGDGSTQSFNGIQVTSGGAHSTLSHSGAGIMLATGNSIDGVDLVGTTNTAQGLVDGNGTVGTLTVNHMAISGQGQIVSIDQGGAINITLDSASSTSLAGNAQTALSTGIYFGGASSVVPLTGTFTVNGATTLSGQSNYGIFTTANASGLTADYKGPTSVSGAMSHDAVSLSASTTTFENGLTINHSGTTGTAFNAFSGTVTVAGTSSITTAAAAAVNLNAETIGSGGVTFGSITTGTVATGIGVLLNNVAGAGFTAGTTTISGTTNADAIKISGASMSAAASFGSTTVTSTSGASGAGIEVNGTGSGAVSFSSVNINNTGGNGVYLNASAHNVTISGGSIGATDDPTGDALNITGGTGAVTVAATIAKTTAGNVVEINGHSTGDINISGAISATGAVNDGILITGNTSGITTLSGNVTLSTGASTSLDVNTNSGGTVNFTGKSIQVTTDAGTGVSMTNNIGSTINVAPTIGGSGLDVTTTSGTGFLTGSGTYTVTGAGNSVTTATGQVVGISNSTIGAAGITFDTLQATGTVASANSAIVVNGSGGAFNGGAATIAGTSTAGSNGISIAGTSAVNFTSATIDNTAADGIKINNGGAVTIGTVDLDGMTGNGVTISNQTNAVQINGGNIGSTNDPAGDALNITGGSAAVTVNANITKTTAGNVVEVSSHATGAINIGGTISSTGGVNNGILISGNTSGTTTFSGNVTATTGSSNGMDIINNTGGAVVFSGGSKAITTTSGTGINYLDTAATGANLSFTNGALVVSTANGTGLNATNVSSAAGSGTPVALLTISGTGNTITSTAGQAVNIVNVGEAITLQKVQATPSSTDAVLLNNAGAAAGTNFFIVTGAGGAAGSGGTLTGNGSGADGSTTAGVGIYLNKVAGVDLSYLKVGGTWSNFGIKGDTVTNFGLHNSTVDAASGTSTALNESAVRFDGLLGTATINNNTIANGYVSNLYVVNMTGTLDRATVQNNTFGLVNATGGNDNVSFQVGVNPTDTGTLKVSLLNNNFAGTKGDFIETVANGNTTLESVVRNNIFANGEAITPGGGTGVSIRSGSGGMTSAATTTFDIAGNQLTGTQTNAYDTVGIFVAKGQDNGTLSGTIQNNTIGAAAAGSNADGIFVRSAGGGTTTLLIQNNSISGYSDVGIHLQNGDGSGTMNATLYGNTTSSPQSTAFNGLFVDNGTSSTDTNKLNLLVGSATNNSLKNDFSAGAPSNGTDVAIYNNFSSTTTINLSKSGSTGNTVFQIIADDNLNPGTTNVGFSGVSIVTTAPALPNMLPLLAAVTDGSAHQAVGPENILSQAQLNTVVDAAIHRWEVAGATAEQVAAMHAIGVSVADLAGDQLGGARAGAIQLDVDAAGHGWFIDTTPDDDAEFTGAGAQLTATAGGGAAGRIDLLTTVMHELGHQIGLSDDAVAGSSGLMNGAIDLGERRLPQADDLAHHEATVAQADGLDLSGLATIVAAHAEPVAAVQGWRVAAADAIDFGTDHGLDTLLAHLSVSDPGHAGVGASGMDSAMFGRSFGSGAVDLGPQLEIRPDMFAHLDHSVL